MAKVALKFRPFLALRTKLCLLPHYIFKILIQSLLLISIFPHHIKLLNTQIISQM